MPFERLQALGEERFMKVINHLMRGQQVLNVAREIQQPPPNEWGLLQDVGEHTLTIQLHRLKKAAAEGMFGPRIARSILADGRQKAPQVRMLDKVSVQVLDRLEELADIQRTRVLDIQAREQKVPELVGKLVEATNGVFKGYEELLLNIQKVRFQMGLDEFKGPITSGVTIRGSSATATLPDGTNLQKQVYEAVSVVEDIFTSRKIPNTAP